MPTEKMPSQIGDDPFAGARPGTEVVVHHESPTVNRHDTHVIDSTHVGPYYGVQTGNGVAFVPAHACSPDDENAKD